MALLDPYQLSRAMRANPYYHRRLGWPVPQPHFDVTGMDFAYYVARYQVSANKAEQRVPGTPLRIDGIVGPKTWAHMNHQVWQPPVQKHLSIGGELVEVPFGVVSFENPQGLSFYGEPCFGSRSDPSGASVNLIVLHWDECLSSHHCFHVLLERKLSAHLLVDADGTVYQTLDLAEARAWHAKAANDRSIGIEIQNPVHLRDNPDQVPPHALVEEALAHTGNLHTRLDFHTVQKTRVTELVDVLCKRFAIQRRLPEAAPGEVLNGLAPEHFRGVCGHYHLSREKIDPGLTLWPPLRSLFARDGAVQTATSPTPTHPDAGPT